MKKRSATKDNIMVSTKNKNKVLICSTPEHREDSPSRDSDSVCDSETGSPVPFFCTQDGADGETDVVWNFYTPKSGNTATSRIKNSTPLSRKSKRSIKPKTIEKQIPKRCPVKSSASQKKNQLYQELFELNQNLPQLMAKNQNSVPEKPQSSSEDDIFNESPDGSPKRIPRSTSNCLRKNLLSSNFGKADPETVMESDDSMNECLLKASQVVEEKFLTNYSVPGKKTMYDNHKATLQSDIKNKMDQESMDAILNSIKINSPTVTKVKKCYSPGINNDSFDSFVGNLNDSALEQLTQMPIKTDLSKCNPTVMSQDWTVNELAFNDSSPSSKSFFGRHNSMPESPSVKGFNKPSTSGMSFGRHSTMPYKNDADNSSAPGDSPIRCTPEEIRKKHQLAREKLMAKRLLPFTTSQQTQSLPTQFTQQPKTTLFKPKVASSASTFNNNASVNIVNIPKQTTNSTVDLKQLIEKKRQEAILRLRRRRSQNK